MAASDRFSPRVRAALDELAINEAAELLAEARADARARVRSLLSDALVDSILEHTTELLGGQLKAPSPEPSEPELGEPAVYVYGVVDGADALGAGELVGLGGQAVSTVSEGELTAIVSLVPGKDFEESELRAHLSDMEWVETVARAHEGVLDQLCRRTTVIPMRMCSVYRNEAGVREMLKRESGSLADALEQLEGKHEWGVKVFFSRARAGSQVPPADAASDAAQTGATYLHRRAQERDLEEQLGQLIDQAAGEIHEALAAMTADSALNPPQRSEVSGRAGEMVLNAVYLVHDDHKEAFEDEVQKLSATYASLGLELVITGPWPAYNFLPGSIGAAW